MTTPRPLETAGVWRLLRGAVVAACATGLSLLGHVIGGGDVPSAFVLSSTALGVALVSVGLSRFSWTLPALVALLLSSQTLLHLVFGWADRPSVEHHLHQHATDAAEATAAIGWSMSLGHAAAALATAVLLRRGESLLARVLDALALRVVRLLLDVVAVYDVRPRPVAVREHHLPRRHTPAQECWQRGPPCG
ncbi:MAG: hypothetical protein ACRDOJ_08325 [Nocardioidaceae bacterium]